LPPAARSVDLLTTRKGASYAKKSHGNGAGQTVQGLLQRGFTAGDFYRGGAAECDFKIPITLDDEIVVSLWLAGTGRTSFTLEYRIHDGKDITYATASTTMVCFDNVKKAAVAIPESIKALA